MSMSTVLYLAQLDSLAAGSFPFTYNLKGFKSKGNRHHLPIISFERAYLNPSHPLLLIFLYPS